MELFIDVNYYIGMMWMVDNLKLGVVILDCEVFGVKGFYVCSSVVFLIGGLFNLILIIFVLVMCFGDYFKV